MDSNSCFSDVTYKIKLCNRGDGPEDIESIILEISKGPTGQTTSEVIDTVTSWDPSVVLPHELPPKFTSGSCLKFEYKSEVDFCGGSSFLYTAKVSASAMMPDGSEPCEAETKVCYKVDESTALPTKAPTSSPTSKPTASPTKAPTSSPTSKPTALPTKAPTPSPTSKPTASPTKAPTSSPTSKPTASPTKAPTPSPTSKPTASPTKAPTSSPTSKPTALPTKAPTPNPTTPAPTACPLVNFDFAGLENGMWLYDQFWESKCVKVTGWAKQVGTGKTQRGFTPINGKHNPAGGAVRVFDTGNKDNCDEDLLTPSPKFFKDFGKNSKGQQVTCHDCCGGGEFLMDFKNGQCVLRNGVQTPNPYVNDKYLGNVLILQEYQGGTDAQEMNACPDDTGKGGYIQFDFCQPVDVKAGRLLDVDGAESADIRFFYADGTQKKYDVGSTGDNGYWSFDYNEENVVKIKFEYTGSGSVEAVEYSYCPETTQRFLRGN
jgi:hypothetical protein